MEVHSYQSCFMDLENRKNSDNTCSSSKHNSPNSD